MMEKIDSCTSEGSGWCFDRADAAQHIWSLQSINHLQAEDLTLRHAPTSIANTKSVINVKSDDNMCFMWSILSALHPIDIKMLKDLTNMHINELNFSSIKFPVEITDIPCFEILNPQK